MISISSKAKKLSKKQAFDSVMELRGGATLSPQRIDELLLYFAPAAPKKAKTAMEWLAKAVAVQDVRKNLEYIWVNVDGMGYATDGHVAHRAQLEGVAEGYYCPKTLLAVTGIDLKYPNVERVFAPKEAHYTVEAAELEASMLPNATAVYSYEGSYAHKAQLDRAMNGDKNSIMLYAVSNGTNSILHQWRGTTEFGDYIIMGIKE